MSIRADIVVVRSRYEAAGHCLVCGNAIPAGEGLTARFGQRTLRFKCPGCLARFEADPQRYLAGHDPNCCEDDHAESPFSEWRCD